MKTRTVTLQFPHVSAGMIAAVVAAAMIVAGAATLIARADTAPVMTNAIQNGSNGTITSAAIGTDVHDTVTIASSTASTTPTGTVDFNLYANTSCSGTPATQSAIALVGGSAQSATTTVSASGLSYQVHYSGDVNNSSGDSSCQTLQASSPSVTLTTALSTSTVLAGSSVYDTATLGGNTASATGTVAYTVYTNNLCTTGTTSAGIKTVANGVVPNSDAILFNSAGTYYWQAAYSGDQFNAPATSACASEPLQIEATSSSAVTITTVLSTSTVLAGSSVYDTATLHNETGDATGTVTYSVYTNNLCTTGATGAGVKTVASGVVPNSDTLLFNTAGTYYWQAVYSGDQNNSAASSACSSEPLVIEATSTPINPPATTTPGTINGNVYNDTNGNDVKDAGESGLSGWTIWLHMGTLSDGYNNPIVKTTTTDGSGNYSFPNLALGTYFVEEQEPAGWTQTSSDTKVLLTDASQGATVNFANMTKNGTTTGHGKGVKRCDGDNDADDVGCTATTTPFHIKTNGDGFFNGIFGHFNFSFKSNGHDNGNHFGQIKNGNSGKGDNDNDNDD